MSARPYQAEAKKSIQALFRRGIMRVLLWLATGGGKTFVFCDIVKDADKKGKRCLIVVRGRKLVDQASKRLFREGVHHGVLMAKHWNYRPAARIQVCSIDTLMARKLIPEADLIVIDEAHLATSEGYHWFSKNYPKAFFLCVTATPYTELPLTHIATEIVKPTSISELIQLGFLVNAKYFAPGKPDLSKVRVSKSTKDYMQEELAAAMQVGTITGDIVAAWNKYALGRPTLIFAATVQHSMNIVAQMNAAGFRFVHCDADTPEPERETIIERLIKGELDGISNVGIFCTGVDIPPVSCIVMARPTKSYNLFIQQAGRGTRPFPGKDHFLILDHAGNIDAHGLIDEEPDATLDGKFSKEATNVKTCEECFAVFNPKEGKEGRWAKCPCCGFTFFPEVKCKTCRVVYRSPDNPSTCTGCGAVNEEEEKEGREIIVGEGELVPYDQMPEEQKIASDIKRWLRWKSERGYKYGWIFYQVEKKYGEAIALKHSPEIPFAKRGTHGPGNGNSSMAFTEAERALLEV